MIEAIRVRHRDAAIPNASRREAANIQKTTIDGMADSADKMSRSRFWRVKAR
jgi:hypothetical protein